MDDRDHSDDEGDRYSSTVSIGNDEDRDSRDECPKNRDKSKHQNNEREGENKWEYRTSMEEWYDDESNRSEDSIDDSDQWLSPEDGSESTPDLASDDLVFPIKKCEIPSLHLREEPSNRLTLYDKNIGEDESDEELGQDDPSIAEVSEGRLSDGLEIVLVDDIAHDLIESEWDRELSLQSGYKSLELCRDLWRPTDELTDLDDDLRDDIDKKKHNNKNEENVEYAHDNIGTIVSECDLGCSIASFVESPPMDDSRYPWPYFEKEIRKKKRDKKQNQKIREEISDEKQESKCEEFFEKYTREYERDEFAEHSSRELYMRIVSKKWEKQAIAHLTIYHPYLYPICNRFSSISDVSFKKLIFE